MSVKLDLELAAPRGAPKTRASLARLRECLAGLVGRMRARCVANHLVKAGILPHVPNDERRFSAPVTPQQAAIALVTAACDDGDAPRALGRAMLIAGQRLHQPGQPPGPSVIDALTAEIDALRRDPELEPREWHFGLAATKALDDADFDSFDLFLSPPVDGAAIRLRLPFERTDVLPSSAIRDAAELWR